MNFRRRVVATTILRIFLVVGMFAVLSPLLLRVDRAVHAQTESPATLTATVSAGAVELSWTAVSGAVRYELWTWWDEETGWQQIGGDSLTGLTYTHTEVTAGTTYHYAVRGRDAANDAVSGWSEYASATALPTATESTPTLTPVTTQTPSATPTATATETSIATATPAAPSAAPVLSAQTVGANSVTLTWQAVDGATGYELYRWHGGAWTQVGGDALTATSYTDSGLTAGQTYYYAAAAVNAAGRGPWSANVQVTLPGTAATATPTPTLTPTPTQTPMPATPTPSGGQTTTAMDRAALVALYNATGGANWGDNTNWLSDKPLDEWHGVTTDDNGRVAELNLGGNELSGTIPSALGNLTNLTELNLRDNQLTGTIPPELGNLSNLEELWLGHNQLSGTIPSELGKLSNLIHLAITHTPLSGSIPSALGNLTNLEILWLNNNDLSGTIPTELGNLTNLINLRLSYNQLSGCVPAALQNVQTNYLDELGLPICAA